MIHVLQVKHKTYNREIRKSIEEQDGAPFFYKQSKI